MSVTDYNPQEDGDKLVRASAMHAALQAYHARYLADKTAVMHYRGSVATYDDLEDLEDDPTVTLLEGDIYNVIESGANYGWTGQTWDSFGSGVDLSAYATKTYVDGKFNTNVNIGGTVTAAGEITAVQTVEEDGQTSTVNHRLTEKLDVDDYHAGYTWGEAANKFTWGTVRGDHSSAHSTTTPNLHLTKPGLGDPLSISVLNSNFDILDTVVDEDDYLSGITWDALAARFTWDDLMGTQGSDSTTTNLSLAKPAHVSAAAENANMDILDAKIGAVGNTSLQGQVDTLKSSVDKLTTNAAFGGIVDMSYNGMVDLQPGWYVGVNNASNSPVPGQYSNMFVAPMKSSNRIFAVAAFDDGSVWVLCGAGSGSTWIRV